ncbi:MAG: hypothetical protein H6Q55_3764, partial [Deltaproteobacteria bacterium]|nr:hypothetical protein [Deltaproteobacteria bacterium]
MIMGSLRNLRIGPWMSLGAPVE